MRDHTKLRAWELADAVALLAYRETQGFPEGERVGLTHQIRKSAVSVASNIVEGCGRASEADYLRFLDIAHGSARELEYQASLATRLGFLERAAQLPSMTIQLSKTINALISSLRA